MYSRGAALPSEIWKHSIFFCFCFFPILIFSVSYHAQHRLEYRKVKYIGDIERWLSEFKALTVLQRTWV